MGGVFFNFIFYAHRISYTLGVTLGEGRDRGGITRRCQCLLLALGEEWNGKGEKKGGRRVCIHRVLPFVIKVGRRDEYFFLWFPPYPSQSSQLSTRFNITFSFIIPPPALNIITPHVHPALPPRKENISLWYPDTPEQYRYPIPQPNHRSHRGGGRGGRRVA